MIRTIAPLAALLAAVSVTLAQTPEVAETAADQAVEVAAEAVAEVKEAVEETAQPAAAVEQPAEEPAAVEAPQGVLEVESTPEGDEIYMRVAPSVDTVIAASPVVVSPAAGPVCCPIRIVASRTTLSARRAIRCAGGPIQTMACVDNPADCTCTHYQIPLCVPCCCVGEPRVCNARSGLLGRGHVDLVWPCGFTAKVVFLVHGGAKIIYVAG